MKYIVTADTNLFIAPKEAAQSAGTITAGTEFESDGERRQDKGKGNNDNIYYFVKAVVNKRTYWLLANHVEEAPAPAPAPAPAQ